MKFYFHPDAKEEFDGQVTGKKDWGRTDRARGKREKSAAPISSSVRIRRYKCFVQIAVLNISRALLYVQRAMYPLLMSLPLE
jgi:hypothetical protein